MKSSWLGFISATMVLIALFATAAAPIPLYGQYAQVFALSQRDLAATSVLYFTGTMTALLFFSRVSNYLGRKVVIYIILVLASIGCAFFAFLESKEMLLLARFIQGLSCGMASSTVMAYMMDTEPRRGLGSAFTTGGPNVGLGFGALGMGIILVYTKLAISPFILCVGVLFLLGVAISGSPETMQPRPGVLSALRPRLSIPEKVRPHILPVTCIAVAGWSMGGFYQAYSAVMTMTFFGLSHSFLAAVFCFSFIGSIGIGAVWARTWSAREAQLRGMTGYVMAFLFIYMVIDGGSYWLSLGGNIAAGMAEGVMFSGALKAMVATATSEERAHVLSLLYLLSYGGAAIPNQLFGIFTNSWPLHSVLGGYVVLIIVCYLLFMVYTLFQVPAGMARKASI